MTSRGSSAAWATGGGGVGRTVLRGSLEPSTGGERSGGGGASFSSFAGVFSTIGPASSAGRAAKGSGGTGIAVCGTWRIAFLSNGAREAGACGRGRLVDAGTDAQRDGGRGSGCWARSCATSGELAWTGDSVNSRAAPTGGSIAGLGKAVDSNGSRESPTGCGAWTAGLAVPVRLLPDARSTSRAR